MSQFSIPTIPEPRNFAELRHAIQFGKRVEGCLRYNPNNLEDPQPGDILATHTNIKTDNYGERIRVISYQDVISVVYGHKHYAYQSEIVEQLFDGTFEEFKDSQWWLPFLDTFRDSIRDLSVFENTEDRVYINKNVIELEDIPLLYRTTDFLGNRRNCLEGVGYVDVNVHQQGGYLDLRAGTPYHNASVYDVDLDQLINVIELLTLIQDKKLKLDVNDKTITIKTDTAEVTIHHTEPKKKN